MSDCDQLRRATQAVLDAWDDGSLERWAEEGHPIGWLREAVAALDRAGAWTSHGGYVFYNGELRLSCHHSDSHVFAARIAALLNQARGTDDEVRQPRTPEEWAEWGKWTTDPAGAGAAGEPDE